LAAGYVAAYARLERLFQSPTLSWHWLVWLVVVVAMIGSVRLASGLTAAERWGLTIITALIAAWLLVPTRASLQPWRLTYVLAFAATVVVWWNLLDGVITPKNVVPLPVSLVLTTLVASILIADGTSLRIGSLGAIGAAALAGGALLALGKRDLTLLRSLLGPTAIILSGILLTSHLSDGLTLPIIALIAACPLVLCLFERGPLARLQGPKAIVVKAALVNGPLLLAIGLYLAKAS
jgi:hypothetical protein